MKNSQLKKLLSVLLALGVLMTLSAPLAAAEDNTYNILYSGELTTLNYLITTSENEYSLAANVIDTLIEYDKFGRIQPALATSWENSEDGLTWTFHIREGVKWVDGNGNAVADVTAPDFVAAAKYILNAQNASSSADIIYGVVAGAEAYYDGTSTPEEGAEPAPVTEWETVGIKALDDYTLEYTLLYPVPYFLSMTTYVCFMPVYEPFLLEKGDQFGLATGNDTLLYCGAFYLADFKPQEHRLIAKNPHNWDAEHVYLDGVEYTYNKEASTISAELYLRGEVDEASIDNAVAEEWLKDPAKADYIRPVRNTSFFSYFYSFNFDPKFDASYEPENWLLAVNNTNFRKAFYYGIDRIKTQQIIDPQNPENVTFNTITPPGFVNIDGLDFVNIGGLDEITKLGTGTFQEDKALEYKDLAKSELEAAGAAFPIKILLPYNPNVTGWDEECQILEQQLEGLFGTDFIDIIVEAGSTQGFLSAVRRSGMYALLKCNWGPDYADPQTFTDPFAADNTYNFMDKGFTEAGENAKIVDQYYALVESADSEVSDITARYEAYAAAESFLIDNAIVVPIGSGTGGYIASRINPFESQYAPFGISNLRYKGHHLLAEPMSTDRYFDEYDKWLEERDALN
ncbi:MAG: peptide ABC transporter substrate-binding protein [Oscillospiraceae bacterium]|nr:peptide ABC transporter substrate-binding protein [Oscillospiraceae bacterium]